MSGLDAVIFDVGNVLLRWNPKYLYRRMGFADEATEAILAATGLMALNLEFDRGMAFVDGIATLVARYPQHRAFLQAFDERWLETVDGAIATNVALLVDLKRSGIAVFVVTNFAREKFDLARTAYPFLDTFDDIVVSGDVRLIKPDPRIFRVLIERQDLDPRRAVFIDDSRRNIDAAAALGFHTIHVVDESDSIRRRLRKLGLPI